MAGKQTKPARPLTEDVYTLAKTRVEHVFDSFDRVVVMFSGGKDSTATLNVALDVARSHPRHARHLPLRTVFYDEEAIPYETEDYVRRIAQHDDVALEWYCLPFKHRNACARKSPWWWPWAPEARHLWCRPLPPEALTTLSGFPTNPPEARLSAPEANVLFIEPAHGNTALLMGIRAQESLTRLRAVTRKSVDNYIVKGPSDGAIKGLWKAYPVYDWTTEDVWTAPAQLGWDYNRAYDRLEMAGVGAGMQRCSPAFGEEPLQKIHTYAQCFPEVWAKMVDRVPGVGSAARYALTELYGYRGRPEKPPGMTWPDFVLGYVVKFEPDVAAQVADWVRYWIAQHYRKTSLPIAPKAPHPVTGVSWDFLLMVALRGDFKHRKQAGGHIYNDEQGRALPKYWRAYVAELAAGREAGTLAELACPVPLPADLRTLIPDYAREAPA